jgi:ABC-2 type transport system permease protein
MKIIISEFKFLLAVWKANLQSAMEYRASFLTQMFGMMLNNAMYFLIWVIFFDRFEDVNGWGISDMYITFGITMLFGNAFNLADIITKGRLDYYLSLPRPVLLHTLASRTIASGVGDFTYGYVSFAISGVFSWMGLLRFTLAILLAAIVFASFMVIIQSLSFWMGNASNLSGMAVNAMITFAIYPITLFDSSAKVILFTLIPAALMGAVPAAFASTFTWPLLAELLIGATLFLFAAFGIFSLGLRHYESGSAIQVEV